MNRNSIWLILILSIIFIAGIYFYNKSPKPQELSTDILWENYTVQNQTIEGRNVRLVVAENDAQWQKGLMYVRKPVKDFDGMIFIFPKTEPRTFWNMNTFEDLSLYWIKDEKVVGKSELPSIEKSKEIVTVSSPEPVNIVVEIIK